MRNLGTGKGAIKPVKVSIGALNDHNKIKKSKTNFAEETLDSVYIPHKNRNNPFISDTLSEIHDEKEKNAIFSHSLKHGVYNEIRSSPLRERLPHDLQIYNPALEKRLFAKEAAKQPGMG